MSIDQLFAVPGLAWLTAAALLAIAELLAPGIFLVFIAAGAGIVGVVLLLVPGMSLLMQVFLFAAATAATVSVGRQWYHRNPGVSSDPLLNDRVARLIGQTVTVAEAIVAGKGRVRVGDGEWPARGPDLPAGATVRIVAAEGGTLDVEPIS
jgi:membrane protein implicated in regulation of membrane protease activity